MPPEKQVSDAVTEFSQGLIKPSSSHDYATGKTRFADTVMGYTHLATATIFLHHDTYLVTETSEDDWERVKDFDGLDYRIARAPAR